MSYFDKLPIISYCGHQSRNLLARSRLTDSTRKKSAIFYPYTMTEEDRVDILSDKYYDDPYYAWLIWLGNDITDPYYDLYINDEVFNEFIIKKYGSLEIAQKKIKCYINNWYGDDTKKTVSQYENLDDNLKKFFNPVLDSNLFISHYVRKKKDLIVNTNKVLTFPITNATGTFSVGEQIKIGANSAFVTFANSSTITCHHVTGTIANGVTITGDETLFTANTGTVTTLIENIPNNENPYWSTMSFYDYEIEKNYQNKEIKLIDNRYKQTVELELKRTLS